MLEFTDKGIFCAQAQIYIDPWQPVEKAVITHGHSDHARYGSKHYLTHRLTAPILKLRLGADVNVESVEYGQTTLINGVAISFFPAGHIVGSAQIRLEYKGEIWVVSGDYKTEDDGISGAFEPIRCHSFITECTFGLPIFKWKPQAQVHADINQWWRQNIEDGKISVLLGYSLGKAQRLLHHLDTSIGSIFAHGAVWNTNEVLIKAGVALPHIQRVSAEIHKEQYRNSLVLAPSSALGSPWIKKFRPFSAANVSGWMNLRGAKRRKPIDRGFVLSDHADWEGLLQAVRATGASRVFATHGYKSAFSLYLRQQGLEAYEVDTLWEGEAAEDSIAEEPAVVNANVPDTNTENI